MGYALRILSYICGLFSRLPAGSDLAKLHNLLKLNRVSSHPLEGESEVLLVQCVEDPYYLILFNGLINSIRRNVSVRVELFIPRSFNSAIGTGWKSWIVRLPPLNWLLARQWINMWESVSTKVGYKSNSFHPLWDCIDLVASCILWKKINEASQLERIQISGVDCGDLIIDSFLRFRPSPRIVVNDPFMLYLIWQAHRDVRRSRDYFNRVRPALYLTTYTTYIQHGIAARVAVQEGVRTFSFGNHQEIAKLLTEDDIFHTRNCLNYKKDFKLLKDSESKILEASKEIENRLSGGIDSATAYMRVSAYNEVLPDLKNIENSVVVFLHDFYDSPHVYGELVFSDFWDWICFTVSTLRDAGIRFLIKPHPNQIALSDGVISELRNVYPDLELIPAEITNAQLVRAGIVCAVTVYGSVAHEMAYMGVPTISCAVNPHVSFSFCHTAKNLSEYKFFLENAANIKAMNVNTTLYREEALEFYVMHNLSYENDYISLRNRLIFIWLKINSAPYDINQIMSDFNEAQKMRSYCDIIDNFSITKELDKIKCGVG